MIKYIINKIIPKHIISIVSILEGIIKYKQINVNKISKKDVNAPVRIVKSNPEKLAKNPRVRHKTAVIPIPMRI